MDLSAIQINEGLQRQNPSQGPRVLHVAWQARKYPAEPFMSKDELILKMGDELLQMSQHLSRLAEKKMEKGWVTGAGLNTTRNAIRHLLTTIGENPDRDGLKETPDRIINSWKEMFSGYETKVEDLFKTFTSLANQMVVVTNIDFVSFCEHHWLPFQGVAHIGYVPNGRVLGLSKFGRVVDVFAKRLQIQEQLTQQIGEAIAVNLKPEGCGVQITARHMCMVCRGVRKENSEMTTSYIQGCFEAEPDCRAEFYSIIAQRTK